MFKKNRVLKIRGNVKTTNEKTFFGMKSRPWRSIDLDINANIRIIDENVYQRHIVKSGESFGEIAKHYQIKASKYKAIFEANKSVLKRPI